MALLGARACSSACRLSSPACSYAVASAPSPQRQAAASLLLHRASGGRSDLQKRMLAANAAAGGVATVDATSAAPKPDDGSVAGKTVIVTGANTGMGLVISKELALQGADVILACRSQEKGKAAVEKVNVALAERRNADGDKGSPGSASLAIMDLASLDSVRAFASDILERYPHIDRLICNAGIMIPPHSFTVDGYEAQFQVNHLSHYLLTRLLLPSLLSSPTRPSIVHVSSLAGENIVISKGEFWRIAKKQPQEYNAFEAYCQSKLAQVLFTVETSRRFGEQLTVNAVHPGIVNTDLFNRNASPWMKQLMDSLGKLMASTGLVYTSEKGASTAIYLATNPVSVTSTGGYWADCAPRPANPVAFKRELGQEWWEQSAEAAGIDP